MPKPDPAAAKYALMHAYAGVVLMLKERLRRADSDRVVLSVYNEARYAPTTGLRRNQYCSFLRGAVRRLPLIDDIEIWNEANSPSYWPQDGGPQTYAALLGHCYDVLHARPGPTNVISSRGT